MISRQELTCLLCTSVRNDSESLPKDVPPMYQVFFLLLIYSHSFSLHSLSFPSTPIVRKNTNDTVSNKFDRILVAQRNYVWLKWLSENILLKLAWNRSRLPSEVKRELQPFKFTTTQFSVLESFNSLKNEGFPPQIALIHHKILIS